MAAGKAPPSINIVSNTPPINPPLLPELERHTGRVKGSRNSAAKIAPSAPIQIMQSKFVNNVREDGRKTESLRTGSDSGGVDRERNNSNGLVTGSDARYFNQQPTQKVYFLVYMTSLIP